MDSIIFPYFYRAFVGFVAGWIRILIAAWPFLLNGGTIFSLMNILVLDLFLASLLMLPLSLQFICVCRTGLSVWTRQNPESGLFFWRYFTSLYRGASFAEGGGPIILNSSIFYSEINKNMFSRELSDTVSGSDKSE